MGIFDQINFNVVSSPDSSYDLRFMDTPCDHFIRDEAVTFDISPILVNAPYSGTSTIFGAINFNGQIDPNASFIITTQFPYVPDGSFSMRQCIPLDVNNPVVETFTVPTDISNMVNLAFPPRTNTVTAQQVLTLGNNEITYIPFTRYNLFQLYGNIQFTNPLDAGATIKFAYLADKKKIPPTNQDGTVNYTYNGLNSQGQGVFTVYGKSILSTQAQLYLRYKTQIQVCPKCLGAGTLNDLNFDQHGRLQLVYDFSKMIQDFFKRFYTDKGSNIFDLTEGTAIPTLIGKAGDPLTLQSLVQAEVINLLFQIRAKQKVQQGIQGIGLAEQIAQINSIKVQAINATDISVVISVTSKSGQTQQLGSIISTVGGN